MPVIKKKKPSVRKQMPRDKVKKGTTSAVNRISNIEFDEDEGVSINIYGRSATGKTTLWGTFPGPILAMVCSGGNRPGELRSLNTPENRKKIKRVNIEEPAEVFELVEYARGKFQTVVMEHATGLYDLVLSRILGIEKLPEQLSWGLASREQYGQATLETKELLRAILNLSCNRVIVAQEREFNTDNDNSDLLLPYVGSALSPSLTGWLNPACDYIVNTFIRGRTEERVTKIKDKKVTTRVRVPGVEYCLRVGPHDVYTTKFRTPNAKLPEVIVNPSYAKIVELFS